MKRRILALMLGAVLLLTLIPGAMAAEHTSLSAGASLEVLDTTPGEYILTYTPNSDLRPVIFYGETLYGRTDLDDTVNALLETGEQAVAGVNASFFDMNTGVPYGTEITEGVLRINGSGNCVGVKKDGSILIGEPKVELTVAWPGGGTTAANYNKVQSATNGLVIYSRDFDTRIKGNPGEVYAVVVRPQTDVLTLGANVSATVMETQTGSSVEIPEGCFVLTELTSGFQAVLNPLKALKAGDQIQIKVSCDKDWTDVSYACGAGELLVENGKAKTSFTLDSAEKSAPRTAIGVKADGSAVIYVSDGNAQETVGKTLTELAARMESLGCTKAVNLDGGGSSTMSVLDNGTWRTVNIPSDGGQRECANFLFLIYDVGTIRVSAPSRPVMTGGKISLNVTAASPSGVSIPAPGGITGEAVYGSVSGGTYTAPMTAGTDTVTLKRKDLKTSCQIQVLRPDSIKIEDSVRTLSGHVLRLQPGERVDLNVLASAGGVALISSDDSFAWSWTEGLGEVNRNGVLTTDSATGEADGVITVRIGDLEETLDVVIGGSADTPQLIAGFESGESLPSGGLRNTSRAYVRYDAASLGLSHGTGTSTYAWDLPLAQGERRLGMWVYGDGSGAALSIRYLSGGKEQTADAGTLDFTGWRYLRSVLDDGATKLTGIELSGGKQSGTVYLDQLVASHYSFRDAYAPEITAQVSGDLSLRVSDGDNALTGENLSITLDGQPLSFTWADGNVTAKLPTDGAQHKLTIYAADAVGNRSSVALTMAGTTTQVFTDTGSHWARNAVNYLGERGILNGSKNAAGERIYRPDDSMTRQEFVVAAVGALGLDLAGYADTVLPFADLDQIASWALPYCKAAYALGLLNGSSSGGKLYCAPTATITRQEAMAILARTQPKGYEEDDLSAFSDASNVAGWARSDIAVMVRRGIISGSGGKLSPTGTVTRAQVAQILYQLY